MNYNETWKYVANNPDLARLILMVDDPARATSVYHKIGSDPFTFYTPGTGRGPGHAELSEDDNERLRELIELGAICHPKTREGNMLGLTDLGKHAHRVIWSRR